MSTGSISAQDINKLRQATGAGMMDCRKALTETNGDFEAAIDWLRKQGQKVAAKRSDREAKEGVVIAQTTADNKTGIVVCVSCETDFVSKNADFVAFGKSIAEAAIANINYRLTSNPAIHYTEIMSDITSAVNLMVNNKVNFVVSDTLTMLGASAGGHLAMLYTYKYNSNNYVKAVADYFGPAKLSDWSWYNSYNIFLGKYIKDILIPFNNAAWNISLYDSNSPYAVATATSKPTIIFHGTIDVIVPLYQSQWMRGQLNTLGVPNEYYEYVDGHGFNNTNTDDAMNKTVAFFKAHLR